MKQDFLNYIQETFEFSPEEMQDFENALSQPLKKTIRVNTNKISVEDFKKLVDKKSLPLDKGESEGVENTWTLSPTPLGKNMFYIDRDDTSIPLGHTLEHIAGYFYVQELAASSSPFYMSGDSVDAGEYTILDMSASPGGKTTQLAEYYPNATIIANEIDKSRMKQLHENLDRLGVAKSYVTNYDGRFFGNFPEIFDKILLDAPCSGEGTAYKSGDALKYWNLKNIRRIAKLQYQLLENALISLKVGGELVYSTCTLNRLENEEILNKLTDNYGDYFQVIPLGENVIPARPLRSETEFGSTLGVKAGINKIDTVPSLSDGFLLSQEGQSSLEGQRLSRGQSSSRGENSPLIRAWPHKNNTGGFFVAKIVKSTCLPEKKTKNIQHNPQGFQKLSNTAEKTVSNFLLQNFDLKLGGKYYTYRNEIYYGENNIDYFWENFFFFKTGIKIGKLEDGIFEPNFYLGTNFGIFEKNTIPLDEKSIDVLFKGEEIGLDEDCSDGYYQVVQDSIPAGIVKIRQGSMKSLLETGKMRKV